MPSRHRFLIGLGSGLLGVGTVAFVFSRLIPVNASTVGFFFLIIVLAIATATGFAAATAVSVAATLAYNYFFLPPIGQFTISEPENWVALFTFVFTSLVASHLSDRAQRDAAEAKRSQQETERLYALSRAILLTDASRPIGPQAAQNIAQIFEAQAVVIFDAKSNLIYRGGSAELSLDNLEGKLQEVVRLGARQHHPSSIEVWPISLGGKPIGALAALAMTASDVAVQSLINLVAIALERVRSEEAASRAEAARQNEEFKSTLLDAIAHEFKTPLTSIKAAANGLRVLEPELQEGQSELVSIIEEETDRLNQLVTEAAKMSAIDAGKVTLQRAVAPAGHLLQATSATFEGNGQERIRLDPSSPTSLRVWGDVDLIVLALRQLVDNGLKYSAADAPVILRAERRGQEVLLSVVDEGPGIPERDRDRVFDKFYRRPGVRNRVPGSGMGLHIAREIARIHGGEAWVESSPRGGSEFRLSLPVAHTSAAEGAPTHE